MAVGMSMPVFASMLAFITYSLTDHGLNPANIFSSLALFNSLRIPLNFLPLVIGQVIDANASVRRIQEFLLAEEAQEDTEWNYEAKEAVVIKDADFTWERHPTREDEDGPPNKKGLPGKKPKKEKKNHQENAQSMEGSPPGSVSKSFHCCCVRIKPVTSSLTCSHAPRRLFNSGVTRIIYVHFMYPVASLSDSVAHSIIVFYDTS